MRNRKGFFLPVAFYWLVAGIIYTAALGWAFIFDHADKPTQDHWFYSAPMR